MRNQLELVAKSYDMLGVNCSDLQGDGVHADFLHLDYLEFDEA